MPRPLHFEVISKIKRQFHALTLQFVDDRPVVDPFDRNAGVLNLPIEPGTFLLDLVMQTVLIPAASRSTESPASLLMLRINLHEDHVLRS